MQKGHAGFVHLFQAAGIQETSFRKWRPCLRFVVVKNVISFKRFKKMLRGNHKKRAMKRQQNLRLAQNRIFIYLALFIPAFLVSQHAQCAEFPSLKSGLNFSYPLSAERNGIEGVVVGKVLVAETGHPVRAEILKRESPECWVFDDAVMSALMNATYRPGKKHGVPVRKWLIVPVRFRLKDGSLQPWEATIYPDNRAVKSYVKMPARLSGISLLEVKENFERTYVEVLDDKKYWEVKEKRTHGPILKLLKKPHYPSKASLSGTEGTVFVKVSVNRNGVPTKAVVVKHDPFNCKVFKKSAISSAMRSEYYPARKNGRAVDGSLTIAVPYFFVQKFPRPIYCEVKKRF